MKMIILKIQAAKSQAAEAPLVLWLQGGPGWPSAFGAFKDIMMKAQGMPIACGTSKCQ